MNFKHLSDKQINLSFGLNLLLQKGLLVYEYNPLRVLRINQDTVINNLLYPKGSLVNLDTDLLNFDLNHPVDIVTLQSYDGSVNLIINDGKNEPKLINSRFSTTGMDTYLIVDREGDNDTNIYNTDTFLSDTSLYKKINNIVKLQFIGLNTDGNLKVGNYVFYFKLADSDGNETDFIAESGIVTCHIGNLNDPKSIQGGLRDANSHKSINFIMSDIESSYDNVIIYYTRSTSDINGTEVTTSHKVYKTFPVYNGVSKITLTGFELVKDVSLNEINVQYNIVDSASSQISCQNMLFLGNVHKPDIPYLELADLSLRFKLQLNDMNKIGFVDENYEDKSGNYEYYNALNIYYKLGYWNDEIYRFGIVYIFNDYTLSPVFNLRGINELTTGTKYDDYELYDANGKRQYINYNKETFNLDNLNENAKGVFRIKYSGNLLSTSGIRPLGLKLTFDPELKKELLKYTKGFFLVRLKRKPTTLCLAVTIGLELTSHTPTIPVSNSEYLVERFFDDNRILTHDFGRRSKKIESRNIGIGNAAICPEFELKLGFFNLLFTGSEFKIQQVYKYIKSCFNLKNSYFYLLDAIPVKNGEYNDTIIQAVEDNVKILKSKNMLFSSRAGEAEEAFRVAYYTYKNKNKNATNILRGSYGPYIGLENSHKTGLGIINIKIPNYDDYLSDKYFMIRYEDSSPFYAITDRITWDEVGTEYNNIFRGDCYIGNYTHRMIRNFQDSTAPINDEIVQDDTWKTHFDPDNKTKLSEINRGDVNAVRLGHWVTVKLCSNVNLSMRCLDYSYPAEQGLIGHPRSFYPLLAMNTFGINKVPESFAINEGYNSTTSDKYNFEQPKVPAIKNIFNTRIMYSDININDSFKNGYRIFKSTNYRDYPSTYGNITKLINWYGNIITIFEHGIALIPINERALAGAGAGGNVFINTANVLPENPKILSDMYGTLWSESIVKTPYYIYGIDTVAKKIWRTNGYTVETISDFKFLKFLNENISLTEFEKVPIIGLRNVKTHYNAFKKDVMFTFYDDTNTKEEIVWNLCWNEVLLKFITFYSWVPSYSENIDNIFFTFDRNTSKEIAKLTSNYPLISLKEGGVITHIPDNNIIGELLLNLDIENVKITYEIGDSRYNSLYSIVEGNKIKLLTPALLYKNHTVPIRAILTNKGTETVEGETINVERVLNSIVLFTQEYNTLSTDFWKHGLAGLVSTDIKPTTWYGKLHPFEFECIVLDDPFIHKKFNNLQIISNKAEPESFHYEIVGEVYSFADDKPNMYYRQEATKETYLNLGSNIEFDKKYVNIKPIKNTKSTIFPLYYARKKELDKILDLYYLMYENYKTDNTSNRNYLNLSGSEIIYDKDLNEFRVATHKGAYSIEKFGRMRGNIYYLNDKWVVEVPSIIFMEKNEEWTEKPPLVVNWIPNDLEKNTITGEDLPNTYDIGEVSTSKWTNIKEAKIRDKYLKIKVRYSGKDLAIITALKTLYTI